MKQFPGGGGGGGTPIFDEPSSVFPKTVLLKSAKNCHKQIYFKALGSARSSVKKERN